MAYDTEAFRRYYRLYMEAYMEARERAKARGLTNEEIDRAVCGDESQFWDDMSEIAQRLRDLDVEERSTH